MRTRPTTATLSTSKHVVQLEFRQSTDLLRNRLLGMPGKPISLNQDIPQTIAIRTYGFLLSTLPLSSEDPAIFHSRLLYAGNEV